MFLQRITILKRRNDAYLKMVGNHVLVTYVLDVSIILSMFLNRNTILNKPNMFYQEVRIHFLVNRTKIKL